MDGTKHNQSAVRDKILFFFPTSRDESDMKKILTLTEIQDMLDDEFEDDNRHRRDRNGMDIVMFPPDDNDNSDGDSDDSDNPSGDIARLSSRLLQAGGEVRINKSDSLDSASDIRDALREAEDSASVSAEPDLSLEEEVEDRDKNEEREEEGMEEEGMELEMTGGGGDDRDTSDDFEVTLDDDCKRQKPCDESDDMFSDMYDPKDYKRIPLLSIRQTNKESNKNGVSSDSEAGSDIDLNPVIGKGKGNGG